MQLDANDVARNSVLAADVVIVGAGAAGITLARSLSAARVDVLLLESGDAQPDEATQDLYAGDVIGHGYPDLDETRLRYLGGTTNHWHGWCRPLDPIDLERREWVPHSGWPIGFDELARWYPEAQSIVQIGPYEYDGTWWAQQHDLGTVTDTAEFEHTVFQFSPPTRFGEVYAPELADDPHVRLVLHANVTNIALTDDGTRVNRLQVRTLAGNTFTVEGRAIVLAAGSLEIVRLLLASRDVHTAGVGNANDVVGRFFTEHPHLYMPVDTELPVDERRFFDRHTVTESGRSVDVLGVIALTDAARREQQVLGWTGELWNAAKSDPDGVEMLLHGVRTAGSEPSLPDRARARLTLRCEQAPNRDSRVVLTSELDALGLPRLALDWRFTDQDRQSADASLRLLGRYLGSRGVGTVRLHHEDGASWVDHARPGNHQLGVTRMSVSPNDGVVDADSRVHGVGNLFISGGAVFTTGGHANPTLTVVALALRLAEHLRTAVLP